MLTGHLYLNAVVECSIKSSLTKTRKRHQEVAAEASPHAGYHPRLETVYRRNAARLAEEGRNAVGLMPLADEIPLRRQS